MDDISTGSYVMLLNDPAEFGRTFHGNFPYSAVKITHEECMTRKGFRNCCRESTCNSCHIIHVAGQITDDWTFCRQKQAEH